MSDRFKYAMNGIYKCDNFTEQVEQNRFPEIFIGAIEGFSVCYLKCTLITKDNQVFLYPSIFGGNFCPIFRFHTFFNVLKKDGSSGSMKRQQRGALHFTSYKLLGEPFLVSELLNPDNEYLDDDGSLSIEYGIQCVAIWDKCWMFNFHDPVFNYTGEENQMVRCTHETKDYNRFKFYCSPEILNFHCPQFVEQAEKIVPRGLHAWHFFRCLQILHGVRLQFNESDYFNVLEIARSFNFSNVIQYIDRLHFEGRHCFWETKSLSFDRVIDFNLKHVLAEKLKELSRKDVVEVAKKLDFTEATGEVMKTFVAKILYN